MGWTDYAGFALLAMAALLGVAALALALDGRDRLDRIDRTPAISEVLEEPDNLLGAVVTLQGEVGRIFHLRPLDGRPTRDAERPAGVAFTLGSGDDRLLVVSADNPPFLNHDGIVRVRGRLRKFEASRFSRGFQLDLTGEPYRLFNGTPALIAHEMEPTF